MPTSPVSPRTAIRSGIFRVGREYNRQKDIHGPFGGQERGGIATPAKFSAVFLFTGEGGGPFGYEDKFEEDGVFAYTGEGQKGDMEWKKGNLAIRRSAINGNQLFLFEQTRKGFVRFVGYAHYLAHHLEQRRDKNGTLREAFVFELDVDVNDPDATETSEAAHEEGELALPTPETLNELRAAALQGTKKNLSPKIQQAIVHYRSEAVKRYVLRRAKGKCEGCDLPAPFLNRKKQPYLEPHHTTRRADGGPDHPAHVIALCPTCHRRVHHGINGTDFKNSFQAGE